MKPSPNPLWLEAAALPLEPLRSTPSAFLLALAPSISQRPAGMEGVQHFLSDQGQAP